MKSSVSSAVATVLIVVLAVFVGFLAYRNFSAPSAASNQPSFSSFDPSKITPEQHETIKRNFEAARKTRNATATGP